VKKHEHQIFNLGSGELYNLFEMAEIVKKHIPDAVFKIGSGPDPLYGTGGPMDRARARDELDHRITFSFEEGIRDWIKIARSAQGTQQTAISAIPSDIPTLRGRKGS
jgi:nucleoside-diphosphate-sugar epimerase